MKNNGVLMFQGTGSNVGKSVLVAAFCRVLKQDGYRVAPFKAQNMALNSYVTLTGDEIGRAQAFQAEACGIDPLVEMNPVLLKPTGEKSSQVVVMGKPVGNMKAVDYYKKKLELLPVAIDAFNTLKKKFDIVVIEGAGSPAEINLKNDFSNMGIAKAVNSPVIIVGDIDCGGVFAWMKGTIDLLEKDEQELVKGFLINKFRGDKNLLQPGIEMFEQMVNRKVTGVLPYLKGIYLDAEDSQDLNVSSKSVSNDKKLILSIIKLPRISNFTDFAALTHEEDVEVNFVEKPSQLENADCIILPGSKNTLEDLSFLEKTGLKKKIIEHHNQKKTIVGICGGFQMLGREIFDEETVESSKKSGNGLELFPMKTVFKKEKILRQINFETVKSPFFQAGIQVTGYEIHMGESYCNDKSSLLEIFTNSDNKVSGLSNKEGTVLGTYLHDCFNHDALRESFLNFLRKKKGLPKRKTFNFREFKERNLNILADSFRENIDIQYLKSLL
ncbi:MAG: cobyric acid synthase [Nitrospinae bacterium]|nr:cobyric acid synthase [Nitrospinota bacterium]